MIRTILLIFLVLALLAALAYSYPSGGLALLLLSLMVLAVVDRRALN